MASDGFQAAAGIAFYGYPNAATDTCIPDVVVYGGGTYGESPGIPDGSVVITYNGADLTFTDDFAGVVSTTMEVDLDVEICDLDIYIDIFYDWNNGGFLGLSTDGGINDLEVDLELQDSTLATVETRILDNDCGPDETVKELYSDEGLEGFSSACIDSVHIPKEPNGDLASFDGKSTQGTWSLKLDDTRTKARVHTNGGSVNCWALVVTPCVSPNPLSLACFLSRCPIPAWFPITSYTRFQSFSFCFVILGTNYTIDTRPEKWSWYVAKFLCCCCCCYCSLRGSVALKRFITASNDLRCVTRAFLPWLSTFTTPNRNRHGRSSLPGKYNRMNIQGVGLHSDAFGSSHLFCLLTSSLTTDMGWRMV